MRLYYADIRELAPVLSEEWYLAVLTEERVKKMERFKSAADRQRSFCAGLLLEYGLREYGLRQRELSFGEGEDGKPYIVGREDIQFNLSHSGNLAAAVFSDRPVGVDIERMHGGRERVAERFFAEEEAARIREGKWEFTEVWTRKESFLKACGMGLKRELSSFLVLEEEAEGMFFQSFLLDDGEERYSLSVCGKEKDPVTPQKIMLCNISVQS